MSRLSAPVPVGGGKALDGCPAREEVAEYAVLDDLDALGSDALVIVAIVTVESDALSLDDRGVICDIHERRQDELAHHVLEGLSLVLIALTVTLDAVPKDLVKEHCGGPAPQDRRGRGWLSHRCITEGSQAVHHVREHSGERVLIGEFIWTSGEDALVDLQGGAILRGGVD